ncbi:MAG: phytoene/squalene synthase family protein [Rhodobacteraceae bacterium]|nr:phytoene/squalene synthase family protein [Paracoccaceae bacterium]
MMPEADLTHCRTAITKGSYSFHAASRLLPARVRDPALALYAFCRLADDEVDLNTEKTSAVLRLRDRLDMVYRGTPWDAPADRAFAAVINTYEMPRTLPEALLEGLAWDGMARRYETLRDLRAYSARVASTVGVMMCVIMGIRDEHALARACDLGVAMQLTNIARDVGEDARAGRLYLPTQMMQEAGIDPERFLAHPEMTPALRGLIRRLLAEADRLYYRSEPGIAWLPVPVQPGIYAARHIYAGIGHAIARRDYNSLHYRAFTTRGQKLGWLGLAILRTGWSAVMPSSAVLYAKPLEEVAFLVEAAARRTPESKSRAETVCAALAQLEAQDRLGHKLKHAAE